MNIYIYIYATTLLVAVSVPRTFPFTPLLLLPCLLSFVVFMIVAASFGSFESLSRVALGELSANVPLKSEVVLNSLIG